MGAKIGAGTFVMGGSYVHQDIQVGDFCMLERGCTVDSSIQPEAYAVVQKRKPCSETEDGLIEDENRTPVRVKYNWEMESAQQMYEDTKIKPPKPTIEDSSKKSRRKKSVKYDAFGD